MPPIILTNAIVLTSSDGVSFEVDEAVALQSQTIRGALQSQTIRGALQSQTIRPTIRVAPQSQTIRPMIEEYYRAHIVIPLPNVTSEILSQVIKYCRKHVENPNPDDAAVRMFDTNFVNVDEGTNFLNVDQGILFRLFRLIKAADYLKIQSLKDLICQAFANMNKGKNPEEILKLLNLKNDEILKLLNLKNDCTPEEKNPNKFCQNL